MILLDTHILIWWVNGEKKLAQHELQLVKKHEKLGLGISVITCWEIAKLVQHQRLELNGEIEEWLNTVLAFPKIRVLDLTPQIAVESTRLPGHFHRDPADQIIVATARIHKIPLVTADQKILDYPHVKTLQE